MAQAISFLSNVKRFPLEWKVYAFLNRPWQLNPKGEVQVQLHARRPESDVASSRATRSERRRSALTAKKTRPAPKKRKR